MRIVLPTAIMITRKHEFVRMSLKYDIDLVGHQFVYDDEVIASCSLRFFNNQTLQCSISE